MITDEAPEAVWRAALAEGRFLLQRAQSTGTRYFPPRVMEPGTGETDLEWVEAMGTGTVYSVSVIGRKPPAAPYHVALIDLDEGPRLMSRVEGMAAEDVRIGMKVKARVAQEDETPILVFDPV
ncbi:hypothetical protein BSL82_14165 [Tardibacter chloracetimidivorans]|uniref:ChsH2 C-terminal OB-fold domain-containing protein n=1 Tax=Tardibacter chloracetimidivorans TaxID=1921510 RepID=A0A1L3ZXD2_9SPHN|nr:Zn-ribbon domain-containing OB-fold protein [Tardibacter chloracetimidivorans]API60292.1 hypothetical protein BSL82_14165 [Tardibacter chloracetimidivorans]